MANDTTTMEVLPPQYEPFIEGVKYLYSSEDYTDLEIVCQERIWKVHKFCLCAQSSFFHKACSGQFGEAQASRVVLDHDDPQVVGTFIHYLYHFDYINFLQTGLSPIVLDVRMYVIADKYFVEPLKALAAKIFEEGATAWWSTRAFADAIAEIYQTTTVGETNPLKETAISIVKKRAQELLDPSKGYHYFLDMLAENGEFGKDISMALATKASPAANACSATNPSSPGDSATNTQLYRCRERDHVFRVSSDAHEFRCPYCDNVHNVTEDKSWWARFEIRE